MNLSQREQLLLADFAPIRGEQLYEKIMQMGRSLSPFPEQKKVPSNKVVGCQSLMYCSVELHEGKLQLHIDSSALISKGLAALVVFLYNNLSIEDALSYRPTILNSLGSFTSLSLTRLNGLDALLNHVLKKIITIQSTLSMK